MKVLNRVGPPVRGLDFFGRERFMDLVWQKLDLGNLLLAAPRRFGKTSILYRIMDEPRNDSKVIHADLESATEPADFIVKLLEGLAKEGSFEGTVGKIKFLVGNVWSSFRNTFEELDIYVAKVKLREDLRGDWQTRGKEIFAKVAQSATSVIFILDEFPIMLDAMLKAGRIDEAKNLLRWFRSVRLDPAFQDKLRFVIAGSIGIDRVLDKLDEVASINDFEKLKLQPFSSKVAGEFLNALCETQALPLNEDIKVKMLDLIGTPIPFFIQVLFSEVHKAHFQDEEIITIELIEKIYRDKVLGVDCKTYFEHYYGRLRLYYDAEQERAAAKILREIAITGKLKKSTCYQVFQQVIGESADFGKFGVLMTELENDFYVTFDANEEDYEFGSKLLRDWWLRYHGMTVE